MMPGFTAPKLLWVKKHEPENFSRLAKVLLPKDYLRFLLSGDYASDLSDAAGMLWLDVAQRDWSDELLHATGLSRSHMPKLFEGNQITGTLLPELAQRWGMQEVPIVAGGGDNAAGAIGVGIIKPGQAMLSLGTSGVYFVVSDGMVANPEVALHSYCHALPDTWHAMSVMLSAASCLDWLCDLCGYFDVGSMLTELEQSNVRDTEVVFLPYLSGERTPHNNPDAKGVFFGMTMGMNKLELVLAVLEGVALAFADGAEAVHSTQLMPEEISLIGGGARNRFWRQIICDVLAKPVTYREGGEVGPALGAARLARMAIEVERSAREICPVPAEIERHTPDPSKQSYYQAKRDKFQAIYRLTHSLM
jgi:xylulokinase